MKMWMVLYKKKVGLKVVNDEGGVFITDTYLDIVDGKTVDEYTKDLDL